MAKALDDLRVIEVANGWGGPLTGRLLADLGAEVIKIESPEGDPLRRQPPFKNGVSYAFEMTAAGKKSVVLDLTTPSGSNSLHQLIEGADVLLCDSSVWELVAMGLRYDELRKTNPGLIYCSLTPFGLTGPLSQKLASDTVVQAMSGVMATTGWPGGPATKAGPALAEHIGAVFATIGIAAALNHRDRTGRGQSVDIAMHDCLVTYLAIYLPQYFVTGEAPPREGNRHTMSAPWNSYPTKDGFVIICSANDKLWNQLIGAIGRSDLIGDPRYDTPPKRRQQVDEVDDIVSEWTRTKTIDEAIAVMDRAGIPAGSISRIDRLLSDPHFHHRQLLVEVEDPSAGKMPSIGSPFKMSETTEVVIGPAPYLGQHTDEVLRQLTPTREKRVQPVAGAQNGARALEGIRIIDFGNLTAGPFSTRILSNLGAEVIKIEALDGDHARHLPPQIKGMGYLFIINNTDKKSITLDLRAPEAKQIVRELVARGDALLENFGPGAMKRQGLGYEDLKAVKPDIIYCSVNGFGGSGPNRSKRAYDTVIQAMAGIMSITGWPDMPPSKTGISVVDMLGGTAGALNILIGLHYRNRTGRGQFLDVAMFDWAAWLTQAFWPPYLAEGRVIERMGNRHPYVCPHNTYPTKDGPTVIVTETDEQWRALLKAIGREELVADPRYDTMAKRLQRVGEVDAIVANWTQTKMPEEIVAICEAAGVPSGPVLEVNKAVPHPQTLAREMVIERSGPDFPVVRITGSPLKLSETPWHIGRTPPFLGEHNEEILCGLLGYSPDFVQKLAEKQVILPPGSPPSEFEAE